MSRLHMSLQIGSLNGLEGAHTTGEALLARMGGLMSIQVAQVPMYLVPTNVTFTNNALAMNRGIMSAKFILVNKPLETDGALHSLPRLASRNRGRSNKGRGGWNRLGGSVDLEARNLLGKGKSLRFPPRGTSPRALLEAGL